jgi:hypothetical protein
MRPILETIFGEFATGLGASILAGAGFTLLADEFKKFRAAKLCFCLAALWIYGKVLMWGYFTNENFFIRALVSFVVFGFVGVGLVEALHLTKSRQTKAHEEPPASTAPSIVQPKAVLHIPELKFLGLGRNPGLPVTIIVKNQGTAAAYGLKYSVALAVSSTVRPEAESNRFFAALRTAASTELGPKTNEIQPGQQVFFTDYVKEIKTEQDIKDLNEGKRLIYVFVLLRYGDSEGTWETGYCAYYTSNVVVAHFCADNNYDGHPFTP